LPPQTLLDEAITWLGNEYGIVAENEGSEQDLVRAEQE
jgi:hypothetical protein